MRFADKGYYIEEYVKCANCGVLVYDQGIADSTSQKSRIFCSDWCREWMSLRDAGTTHPVLRLPRGG